jgi:hypothetical protein
VHWYAASDSSLFQPFFYFKDAVDLSQIGTEVGSQVPEVEASAEQQDPEEAGMQHWF